MHLQPGQQHAARWNRIPYGLRGTEMLVGVLQS